MNSHDDSFAEFVSKLRTEVDRRATRLRKQECSRNALAQNLKELDEQIRQLQGKPVRNNDRSDERNELVNVEEAMMRGVDKIDALMRSRIARVPSMNPAPTLSNWNPGANLDAERRVEFSRPSTKFLENLERARDLATAIEQRQTSPRLVQPKLAQPMTHAPPYASRVASDLASTTESDARQVYRVTLTIVGAANLPDLSQDKWLGGCCDPYVKLHLGGETVETSVSHNTRNPTWNLSRTLERVTGELELDIEVWDKRKSLVADILLGQCEKLIVRLNAFSQDEPSELRIPIRVSDGAHDCYVTIKLWTERWMTLQAMTRRHRSRQERFVLRASAMMASQFYSTSVESSEGSPIDEDTFIKLQLCDTEDSQPMYARVRPDRGRLVPLEVVSIETPMIQSKTWVEVRLSLIRKERRFIGKPVEHETALFGNIKARVGAPSYLTIHWDKQHQYKLESCLRLRCRTSNFLVPSIPATMTARSDYVRWVVSVNLPQRSAWCPSHGDTQVLAELRLPPFTQETATASCAIPGCMRFDAISTQNESEVVMIIREGSSTAALAFTHFVAREDGPVSLVLNSLCPSCSLNTIEASSEVTPWIYVYLGTLEGKVECLLGEHKFQVSVDRPVVVPLFDTATDLRFPQHGREYHLRNYLSQDSLHPCSVELDMEGATVRLSWSLMPVDEVTNLAKAAPRIRRPEPARYSDGRRYRIVLRVISVTGSHEKACLVRLDACSEDVARSSLLLPARDADELIKMSCSEQSYTKRVEPNYNVVFNSDVTVDVYLDSIVVFSIMDPEGSAISIGALDLGILKEDEELTIPLEPFGDLGVVLTSKPARWPFVCLHQIGGSSDEIAYIRCTPPGHEESLPLSQPMVLSEVNPDAQLVIALLNTDEVEISTMVVKHIETGQMLTFKEGLCFRVTVGDQIEDSAGHAVSKPGMRGDTPIPGVKNITRLMKATSTDMAADDFPSSFGSRVIEWGDSAPFQSEERPFAVGGMLQATTTGSDPDNQHERGDLCHENARMLQEELRRIRVEVRHLVQGGLRVEPSIFLCDTSPLRIKERVRGATAKFGMVEREQSIFITGSRGSSCVGWHEIDLSIRGKSSVWVAFRLLDSEGSSTEACGEYRVISEKYTVL